MIIPKEVKSILKILEQNNFEVFIVGGCVRDSLRNAEPKDWDIATNAKPEEIEKVLQKKGFKTVYENKFGTVTVVTKSEEQSLREIEITPYRIDEQYTDKRHPDKIKWTNNIEQDLERRDFTVNALAMNLKKEIIDPFSGRKDLENKIIRAVKDPKKRFAEDSLRMMRAVRFAITLGFEIEEKTKKGIKENAKDLKDVSQERIREELIKIIMSQDAAKGIETLRRLGLLKNIIPEIEEGFNVAQNKHHVFQIYEHNLLSLNYACENNFSFYVRMAALLHDVGKPRTKRGTGLNATFYNHEIVGANITNDILQRLKFPKKDREKIVKLVRLHLFYYNVDEVGESSVRRLLKKAGKENITELMQLRYSDRIGSGVPKAEPYKLRHLKYLFEKVSKDPISAKMIEISGNDIMKQLNIRSGPRVGHILSYLLSEILKNPKQNNKSFLKEKVAELGKLDDNTLSKKAKEATKGVTNIIQKEDKMTKGKYWVS